jgi:hypothetical protein
MPLRATRTLSPGDSVLVIAASQPPVPVAGKNAGYMYEIEVKLIFSLRRFRDRPAGRSVQ